jgi:hypothetical protein
MQFEDFYCVKCNKIQYNKSKLIVQTCRLKITILVYNLNIKVPEKSKKIFKKLTLYKRLHCIAIESVVYIYQD